MSGTFAQSLLVVLCAAAVSCAAPRTPVAAQDKTAETAPVSRNPNPMLLGVDDAGKRRHIYEDPVMQAAFEEIGFDFLMHHIQGRPTLGDIDALARWAKRTGKGFWINQENTTRPRGDADHYRKPGYFFQPSEKYIQRCLASEQFMGVCYDEAEHWATNGVWITGRSSRGYRPHFYDAEGDTLTQAYEGNLLNLRALMKRHYVAFAEAKTGPLGRPIVATEHVFPIYFHTFGRAGISPMAKLLKETVTPVAAAMALGAAKQYRTRYVTCLDLWAPHGGWPGHSPEALRSAMLFSYWTGAQAAYIENFNYRGQSLYRDKGGKVDLTAWGQSARRFKRTYMPANPRAVSAADFAPEIVIVRFPDTDWGQRQRSYIRENLYGATNLKPDARTRYWINVWHVISHGTIPPTGLTWHGDYEIPFRFFFPANNVAVYDHLAADEKLYISVKLVFLTGKKISKPCMETLAKLSERGMVVVTPPHLAPKGMAPAGDAALAEYTTGRGKWIVTDDVTHPSVRRLLAPYLGGPDRLRYVFGKTEVIFTAPNDPDRIEVAFGAVRAK